MRHGCDPAQVQFLIISSYAIPEGIILSIALSWTRVSTHLNISRLVSPMSTIGLIVLKDESAIGVWRWGPGLVRICLTNGAIGHFTIFHCASVLLIRSNWPLRQ